MNLSNDQAQLLLGMLTLTKPVEEDCGHCIEHMAEFVETTLAGKSLSDSLVSIDEHLQRCADCRDEFEALRGVISSELPMGETAVDDQQLPEE